jgi:hypothetical protein
MWIFLRPKWYSVFVLESFDYLSTIYLMSWWFWKRFYNTL